MTCEVFCRDAMSVPRACLCCCQTPFANFWTSLFAIWTSTRKSIFAEFSMSRRSLCGICRNGGGTVTVVTKSGTNNLHGSVFDYLRNDVVTTASGFQRHSWLAAAPLATRNWLPACPSRDPLFEPRAEAEQYGCVRNSRDECELAWHTA